MLLKGSMMKCLIVLILTFLAASKVGLQGNYAKKYLSDNRDTILFNACIFCVASFIFLPSVVGTSIQTIFFSIGFACCTVVFQLTYTKALSLGNVSLTVMLVNLSMLFPVILSTVYFNESLSFLRGVGILLTLISFLFSVNIQTKEKSSKKWFLFTMVAMIANGGIGVIQKFFGMSQFCQEKSSFVAWAYIFASALAFIVFCMIKHKGNAKTHVNKSFFFYAIIIGCILGCFQLLNTYAIATINGTFLFPTYAGGSIILSTALSLLWCRERLHGKQTISLIIGIVAIILMNF